MRCFIFIGLCCIYTAVSGQVGINTTNPQQELHLGSSTGSLRIESLNHMNNPFNGGDIENDGSLTNNTFPLYVDDFGNFTLELKMHTSSEATDALDDTSLPTSSIFLPTTDTDGDISTTIKSYIITVNRPAIIEIKYSLSFKVYLNSLRAKITDNKARRISTWIAVNGLTRMYGPSSKCYSSGSTNSVAGTMYGSSTAYVSIASAGTYTISLMGGVSSNIRSGGGPGGPTLSTFVEFATGNDFMFIRIQ